MRLPRLPSVSLWRDLGLAGLATAAFALLAGTIDLHEHIYAFTRQWERWQLDEWPEVALFFACCMVLLYARRHSQLRQALAENRELVGRIIDVQEQERRHLARELHDELGQHLNAIKLDAQALADGLPDGVLAAGARRLAAGAGHVYGVAGNLVRQLRPPALDDLGLVAALEACVDSWRRLHPDLQVQLSTGGRLDDLGEQVNLAVYRMVQEALTNCVRHAQASRMFIDLTRTPAPDDSLLLEMRDDGKGMASGATRGGGLAGMRERTSLVGGRLQLLSQPGRGVTIRVEIPLAGNTP